MPEYAAVKALPAALQDALNAVNYGKADIEIRTAVSVTMSDSGQAGRRAFVTLIDLASGRRESVQGSWGGPNMFNTTNPVDNDSHAYPLPPNGAVITGSTGGGPTYATVYIPASMRSRMLPSASIELTAEERDCLYVHKAYKGGAYRRDELARRSVTPAAVDAMVSRGLLKRNAAGAVSITTDGKNAVGEYRGH